MSRVRKLNQKRGWAYTVCAIVVKPTYLIVTRPEYVDGEKIPATGGVIIAANHLSHADPFSLAMCLYDHGRLTRFLAKERLFETPIVGPIVKNARQIPVSRQTHDAAHAYSAAVAAVNSGELVMFYPEGTITRDPGLWPMRGKTGAARVALTTGAPLVPIGQWGIQELMPPYGKPNVWPPKRVRLKVGDPVDLDDLRDQPLTNEVLHQATDRLMAAITGLVADLRGETAPVERFDPKKSGVAETGNPYKRDKGA